ncbi:MAG TPA: YibE/F family protein [Pseudonocardia sp.]|uniref:YibE/F family protein n=1 Tax=Pseudonocardia sp. TaxID=60912 RepID=UPI002BEB0CE1|nr:YibE/F family protein [Pseudonocardia sp.]HTF53841.1 YibE/F family protein [Pseudonocardia sp.]
MGRHGRDSRPEPPGPSRSGPDSPHRPPVQPPRPPPPARPAEHLTVDHRPTDHRPTEHRPAERQAKQQNVEARPAPLFDPTAPAELLVTREPLTLPWPPRTPSTPPPTTPANGHAPTQAPGHSQASGHGHGHGHGFGAAAPASRRVRLLLAILLVPCAVASVVGVLLLYPFGGAPSAPGAGGPQVNARVGAVTPADCSQSSAGQPAPSQAAGGQAAAGQTDNGATGCVALSLLMSDGPAAGKGIVSVVPVEPTTPIYTEGDKVVLAYSGGDPTDTSSYQVVDFQRGVSLWLLGLLFAAAVILLGRWKGVAALIALGASFVVLIGFMLPAILAGRAPLEVALVGSCLIMFAVLYISYGVTAQASTAVLGTLVSLGLIGLLSWAFTAAAQLTGLDDPTQNLIAALGGSAHLDPRGLLLAGFVIGALGVLDDVTVTQTSAVWELRRVNASLSAAELFASAMRIGRDHISSAVNTLVLAYAGAALPLMLFFTVSGKSLGQSISAQDVASEVVRTLAGSIGLVASVPITTAVAALVASREPARGGS